MRKMAALLPAALTLAACQTTTTPLDSANVYRASETMRAQKVAFCSVAQSRYVAIVGDTQADQNRNTANQAVGVVAGALIGNAIGANFGKGDGNDLAKNLGAIAGGVAGNAAAENMNARRVTRTGVEYTVDLGETGLRTIVQELNPGETPLPAGASCVVSGTGSKLRVRGA